MNKELDFCLHLPNPGDTAVAIHSQLDRNLMKDDSFMVDYAEQVNSPTLCSIAESNF